MGTAYDEITLKNAGDVTNVRRARLLGAWHPGGMGQGRFFIA
jgi:hypothetical protein